MSVDAGSACAGWTDSLTIEASANVAAPNGNKHANANGAAPNSNRQPEWRPIFPCRPQTVSGDAEYKAATEIMRSTRWDDCNYSNWQAWHDYKRQSWRGSHEDKNVFSWTPSPRHARGPPKRAKWLGPGPSGVLIPEEAAEIDVEVQLKVTVKVKNGTMTIKDLSEKALRECDRMCWTEWYLDPTRYRLRDCEWKDPWDQTLYWSPKIKATRCLEIRA